MHVQVWRSEANNISFHLQLPSVSLSETVCQWIWSFPTQLDCWPASTCDLPAATSQALRLQAHTLHPAFIYSGSGGWTPIFMLVTGRTVLGHWSGCLEHHTSENNGCVTDLKHGYHLPTSCPSSLARLQDQQRTLHQTLICNSQELPDTKWADAKTSRWGRKINKL